MAKAKPSSAKSSIKNPAKVAKSSDDSRIIKRDPTLLVRKNADDTVAVLDLNNEKYFFTLDGIAAEFWMMLDGKLTLAEIKKRLIKKHSPPLPAFDRQVETLIKDLKKEKLLVEG